MQYTHMKSIVVSLKGRRAHALYLQLKLSHIYIFFDYIK